MKMAVKRWAFYFNFLSFFNVPANGVVYICNVKRHQMMFALVKMKIVGHGKNVSKRCRRLLSQESVR
jgi:hypothetical protein